ncbi:molecular chaperone [Citrobacter amalonaticus]|nr:molecular chaperone [Citrobacter amalonaticus]
MKNTLLRIITAGTLAGITFLTGSVQAAISLDRTRIIYDAEQNSMTLNISNENKQLPYLAQTWLENESGEKITTGPLVVTPPLQRLEPGGKSLIRIQSTEDSGKLSQDRESVFWFSLREIPPKSEKPNVLQIALQTRVKLFYRPASLKAKSGVIWQEKLVLHPVAGGYRIENPTPYFITVIGMGGTKTAAEKAPFDAIMLSPKSSETVKISHFSTPYLTYINDYGGRPVLSFNCRGDRCTVVPMKNN